MKRALNTPHIIMKHRGVLGAYGYHNVKSKTQKERRAALDRAAETLGWLYLIRKLNALYVFNKHRHRSLAAKFRTNREYASSMHRLELPKRRHRHTRTHLEHKPGRVH